MSFYYIWEGFMAFLSDTKEKRIKYLEEERGKIWQRITELEKLLKEKTSDHEKGAKQSSKMASQFRNKCKDSSDAAQVYLTEVEELVTNIKTFNESFTDLQNQINESLANSSKNENQIIGSCENAESQVHDIKGKIDALNEIIENNSDVSTQLAEITVTHDQAQDLFNKMNNPYKTVLKRKQEIDEVYYEIMGYDEDSEGEGGHVEGLKDQLEESYKQIKKGLSETQSAIADYKDKTYTDYGGFTEEKINDFIAIETKWEGHFLKTLKKIEGLLPKAMTAGLSSAYSEKREEEVKDRDGYYKNFVWGIISLIAVSLIPFGLSVYLLTQGLSLKEVLIDMPRLVVAILPLYIPVLWLAYSANKKVNLSKRLIEEYTHKEVLAKTFEGLSKQIENIDNEISSDLRLKLLTNLLEVSSENPGKLISNWGRERQKGA
jgi:uncharacterized protein YoxC/tetrahydromethanopterin S-methyltransferase subunit B